jgi:transcriptional regulator with GAF, ATPase, and Fis domain
MGKGRFPDSRSLAFKKEPLMKEHTPEVAKAGWYVDLKGPAHHVLTRRFPGLGKNERKVVDAQVYLYTLDRTKLKKTLDALWNKRVSRDLVLCLSAEDALRWGELEEALKGFERIVSRCNEDDPVTAWAHLRRAEVLERMGKLEEAHIHWKRAQLTSGEMAPCLAAVVHARLLFRRGELDEAIEALEASPPSPAEPSPVHGAWLRAQAIYWSLSRHRDRALGQHKRALDCFKALGDRYMLAKQYLSLAQSFMEGGERDHAQLYCDKAADLIRGGAPAHLEALVKSRSGMNALLQGDLYRAAELFYEDLEIGRKASLVPGQHYAARNLGKVWLRLGKTEEGLRCLESSRKGFSQYGDAINGPLSRLEEIAGRLTWPSEKAGWTAQELESWHAELRSMARSFRQKERTALVAQVESVEARLLVRKEHHLDAQVLAEKLVADFKRHHRTDRLVEFLLDFAQCFSDPSQPEAQDALRVAFSEAEEAGLTWAAQRALKALDEGNENVPLAMARAPRIPTEIPNVISSSVGFYEKSASPSYQTVLKEARSVAPSDLTVLLQGETGVGKDWMARYILKHSHRCQQIYRAYNCSAVSETLLEAELFGYEKGAFTGATSAKIGLFEAADGGTVLLDEVGELSPRAQTALLRFLDNGVVQPVGSTQPRKVDVRVLASTNRDLRDAVSKNTFRADLYYRLAVYTLHLPALRERSEDIPSLVQHFLQCMSEDDRQGVREVDHEALGALMTYPWPGNLRELQNVIQSAVIRARGETRRVRRRHLPRHVARPDSTPAAGTAALAPFPSLQEMEQNHIKKALALADGNISGAARLLGIHRNTLANKIRRYGLEG